MSTDKQVGVTANPEITSLPGDTVSQFPRGVALPSQSPLYWVEQKDRYLRQLLIRDIEALTGRRLIVYYSNRANTAAIIDHKDAHYMTELMSDCQNDLVDLLLETNGGITDATEGVLSAIRNTVPNFRVIVARAAKSGGTIIALASSEIVMGPSSELGPIDPQFQNIPVSIIIANPNADFGLKKMCENWTQQTQTLARKCLKQGMFGTTEKLKTDEEIAGVVDSLSSGRFYFSHGSAIDHAEATQIGLTIKYLPPDDEVWKRIWLLYSMYEYDCREKNLLKIFESSRLSNSIAAPIQSAPPPP
jgi:Serine dehydrogenase proteinase